MKIRKLFLFALIGFLPLCSCGSKLDFSLSLKSYDELKSNIKEYKNEVSKEEFEKETSKYKDFFDLDTSKSYKTSYLKGIEGKILINNLKEFDEKSCQVIICDAKNQTIKDTYRAFREIFIDGELDRKNNDETIIETKKDENGNFVSYYVNTGDSFDRYENWDSLYFNARNFFELEFSTMLSGNADKLYIDNGIFTKYFSQTKSIQQYKLDSKSYEYYIFHDISVEESYNHEITCYRFQFN